MQLRCANRVLTFQTPLVMGVVNVTPDSFSDGGHLASPAAALDFAQRQCEQGASLIDVGGESTRPGAPAVSTEEELQRVLPVVELLAKQLPVPVSVDTSNPEVMRRAAAAGAQLLNDVRALRRPGALQAAADSGLAICLMHMQGEPADMQLNPRYADVVLEVREYLQQRVAACAEVGISRDRLCIDPGFGFGKTLAHNLQLLRGLPQFAQLRVPLLVGLSRKSMIRALTGRGGAAADRVAGSVALATIAVLQGAQIIRAHDVGATVDAVRIAHAVSADDDKREWV